MGCHKYSAPAFSSLKLQRRLYGNVGAESSGEVLYSYVKLVGVDESVFPFFVTALETHAGGAFEGNSIGIHGCRGAAPHDAKHRRERRGC